MNSGKQLEVTMILLFVCFGCGLGNSFGRVHHLDSTGTVSGQVIFEGKPLSGVRVFLFNAETSASISATPVAQAISDKDGKYRVEAVPVGAFRLVPAPGPYVLGREGTGQFGGFSVVLREGEQLEGINLDLKRGAVIGGRVTDSEGQPVIGKRISVLRVTKKSEPQVVALGGQLPETDDLGVYRVFGLEAGKYLVRVVTERMNLPGFSGQPRSERPSTYYPGVTELSRASAIEVDFGSQIADANITLSAAIKTYAVVGEVIDAQSGQPLSSVKVTYAASQQYSNRTSLYPNPSSITDEKGRFSLAGIKSGSYVLTASAASNNLYCEPLPFEVATEDVTGLQLRLLAGSSISGAIEVSGKKLNDPDLVNSLNGLTVLAVASDQNRDPASRIRAKANVQADGRFELSGLKPGLVRLLLVSPPGQAFALLRTEMNGIDRGSGIEVRQSEVISGVRLIVVNGKGNLVGTVKTESGVVPDGATFSVSVTMLNTSPALRSFSQADKVGKFNFANLAPGEYEINVIMSLPSLEGRPTFQSAKQIVVINQGQTAEVLVVVKPRR